jgi:intracellular multiplication protein IcmJ
MSDELRLSAVEGNWRLFMKRRADKAFLHFQKKVFLRDRYTCRFCNFASKEGLEVINVDENYFNNKMSNLITVCPLCAQCFFIESIGQNDFGGGLLIYAQEIGQVQINALCHVLFASIVNNLSGADQARNIYRGLKLRSQLVERYLGEGMSQPSTLGRMVIDRNIVQVQSLNNELLGPLRLLPAITYFVMQIKAWNIEAFNIMQGASYGI